MSEAFRSGLEAVDKVQLESAQSLGMNRFQTMRYVILPQAVSISIPAFMANVIFLLKETSVFSAVSLMDLMGGSLRIETDGDLFKAILEL